MLSLVITALVLVGGYLVYRCLSKLSAKSLDGKVAVITGAGTGIGKLLAIKLASEHGMTVALWGRTRGPLEETEKEIIKLGGKCKVFICDVADREKVYATAKAVVEAFGPVYMLVNNAGIVSGKTLLDVPDDLVVKSFEVNSMAHIWTMKAFLPTMLQKNSGHVVSIASMAGQLGTAGLAYYCGSKFAAVGIDEAVRFELKKARKSGVTTSCICPFYIDTGMFDGAKLPFPANLLMPVMSTEFVVDQTIAAIRENRALLLLPAACNLIALGRILPTSLFDSIIEWIGVSSSMDDFHGHGRT
jgi:all-trans-retinol dehydrogenase (NAD+)